MIEEFRKTHLLRAALQRKGAPKSFIDDLLSKIEGLATSPDEFKKWDQPLDDKGVKVLKMILSPGGDALADVALKSMLAALEAHYRISPDDLKSMSQFN